MIVQVAQEMSSRRITINFYESSGTRENVRGILAGQMSLLLPGDIEAEVERELVHCGTPLASTVLKAAHHGSCSSTTQVFLEPVDPEVAVISVGAENDFGHPCEEVLGRLGDTPTYRTDENGAVEIVSDGTRMWVKAER